MTALSTFFDNRAAAQGHYCPCCKTHGYEADEMALNGTCPDDCFKAVLARYRAPICIYCMGDHITTEDGAFVHRDNAIRDPWGDYWANDAAMYAAEADADLDAGERASMARWR